MFFSTKNSLLCIYSIQSCSWLMADTTSGSWTTDMAGRTSITITSLRPSTACPTAKASKSTTHHAGKNTRLNVDGNWLIIDLTLSLPLQGGQYQFQQDEGNWERSKGETAGRWEHGVALVLHPASEVAQVRRQGRWSVMRVFYCLDFFIFLSGLLMIYMFFNLWTGLEGQHQSCEVLRHRKEVPE